MLDIFPVITGHFRVTQGIIVAKTLVDQLALNAGGVPRVPGETLGGIGELGDLGLPEGDGAPEAQVGQRGVCCHTLGQGLIQGNGMVGTEAVIHPIAGFYHFYGLFGCGQFFLILSLVVHVILSLCNFMTARDRRL